MNPANVTISRGIFAIAGPKARKLLVKVIELPLGNDSFLQITVRISNVQLTSDVCTQPHRRAGLGTSSSNCLKPRVKLWVNVLGDKPRGQVIAESPHGPANERSSG